MATTDPMMRSFHQLTSGARKIMPILERHGMHSTIAKLEVMVAKLKVIIPNLRDVELLAETGCCCGEIRGKRNSKPLCESCYERACGGGSL